MTTVAPAFSLRRYRAFSLVEILVVIVIIAVGSTVALYGYASYRNSLVVETSARLVQRNLLYAKNRAISYRVPHDVVVDLDRDTIWVDELDPTGSSVAKPKVAEEEGAAEFVDIALLRIGSADYAVGERRIRFSPDGTNPFVVVHLIRDVDDANVDANYTSVELAPTSVDARVVLGERL